MFSDKFKKKTLPVLTLLAVGVVSISAYFYFSPAVQPSQPSPKPVEPSPEQPAPAEGWKRYTNEKYSFSVDYPGDWDYLQSEGGKTVGFTPSGEERDPYYGSVTVSLWNTDYMKVSSSLVDYLRDWGVGIQNYGDLVSLEKVITDSGIEGYRTTWQVELMDGRSDPVISQPIVFYEVDRKDASLLVFTKKSNSPDNIFNKIVKSLNYIE